MKYLISCFIALFFTCSAFSFDTKTHVWVSQQVINDLADGTLDIGPFKGIPVDDAVTHAILRNPRVYRMGNVGPDGYPDLISGQQTTHPGIEGGWNTDDWLRHIREAGDNGSEKMRAFAYGYLGHAAADTFAHTYVNWYAGDAFSLGNGVEEEIRHTLVEKFIAKHQPPLVDNTGKFLGTPGAVIATENELPILEIAQSLVFSDKTAAQYSKLPITTYLAYSKYLYDSLESIENNFKSLDKYNFIDPINKIQTAIQKLYVDQAALPYYVTRDVAKKVCENVRFRYKDWKNIFVWQWAWSTKLVCKTVTETIKVINPEVQNIEDKIQELIVKQKEITKLHFWAKNTIGNWKDGVYKATKEYLKTSSLIARGLMSGEDAKAHFDKWKSCYIGVYIGIPVQVTNGACYANQGIHDFLDKLDKLENLALALVPSVLGPVKVYREIRRKIDGEVKKYLKYYAEKKFGKDIFKLVAALKGNVTADSINFAFTKYSGGDKGLLKIGDVAQRIKYDMGLGVDNKFNINKFNLVHNAVTLAKLALLNHQGINSIITKAGSSAYAGNSDMNVLEGFLKSIDGNHQWFHTAPAYPRKESHFHLGASAHREHGYGLPDGFLFWRNTELREKVFRRIFRGPVAPGLEYPQMHGMKPVLSSKYSYQTCSGIPFPDSNIDNRCLILPLIPIFTLMNQ